MAVDPLPRAFVDTTQKLLYPANISPQHYQLKQFISTVDKDFIYYVAKRDVFSLHIPTRRLEKLATLSAYAQCLGAGCGWICVGSDIKRDSGDIVGQCAFINISESRPWTPGSSTSALRSNEVDALLPLDLDPHSRLLQDTLERAARLYEASPPLRRAKVTYHEIGQDIINSITIHKLKGCKDGTQEDVVALIPSNDCTISIWSLPRNCLITKLSFPVCMNHASISPDGSILVACGDEPKAFFFKRKSQGSGRQSDEWEEVGSWILPKAKDGDMCFASAFSPSGHICAVASELSSITIFDCSKIDESESEEAIVTSFFTSRRVFRDQPNTGDMRGAPRSLAFSPGPLDLLAWAEDYGRVCVADLRECFQTRQIIEICTSGEEVERVETSSADDTTISDPSQLEVEARFLRSQQDALDSDDNQAAIDHAREYIALQAERRRLEQQLRQVQRGSRLSLDVGPHGVTPEEQEILDSLASERLQNTTSYYADGPFAPNFGQTNVAGRSQIRTERMARLLQDRERFASQARSFQPRRRTSVVISTSNNPVGAIPFSSSAHPSSLAPVGTSANALSTSPSQMPTAGPSSTSTLPDFQSIARQSQDSLREWQEIRARRARTNSTPLGSTSLGRSPGADLLQQVRNNGVESEDDELVPNTRSLSRDVRSPIGARRDALEREIELASRDMHDPGRLRRLLISRSTQSSETPTDESNEAEQGDRIRERNRASIRAAERAVERITNASSRRTSTSLDSDNIPDSSNFGSQRLPVLRERSPAPPAYVFASLRPRDSSNTSTSARPRTPVTTDVPAATTGTTATTRVLRLPRDVDPSIAASTAREYEEDMQRHLSHLMHAGGVESVGAIARGSITENVGARYSDGREGEGNVGLVGVGWSHDGRMLYVGSHVGIWGMKVDVRGRMRMPSVEMS